MINSKQDFIDVCLRKLGGGVINVEVSDDQLEDCYQEAIAFYTEFHYDGIERDFLVHKVTGTNITLTSGTGFTIGDTITGSNGSTAVITEKAGNIISVSKINGLSKFIQDENVTNGTEITTVASITLGDVDNGYLEVDDDVVGVLQIMNQTSVYNGGYYMWNPQYQLMMNEMQSIVSGGGMSYYYSVMQYMGELSFNLRKEKSFRFNRRWNKIYIDSAWGSEINIGDLVSVEVYRSLNPDVYIEMLEDRWLKEYATTLIKKQLGTNLKKYSGVTLPGGITYNGQQIYNEAIEEKAVLENEIKSSGSPLLFMIG